MSSDERLLSVLAPVLNIAKLHPSAYELVINKPGEAHVKSASGLWLTVAAPEVTFQNLHAMALSVANHTKQKFDITNNGILFGTLPSGERLTFVGPPVCADGIISLTMRLVKNARRNIEAYDGTQFFSRFTWLQQASVKARYSDLTPQDKHLVDLLSGGDLRGFLLASVLKKLTMGISGDTGSGKTFLMECLIQAVPLNERLLTVESARELKLPLHENKVQLAYSHFGNGASGLDANALMALTKRMNPSRVFLGECIGPEAFVFLGMVLSGHAGSITSWHTKSLEVARDRFVLMCREHADARNLALDDLNRMFNLALDVMVYIEVEPAPNQSDDSQEPQVVRYVKDVFFDPRPA